MTATPPTSRSAGDAPVPPGATDEGHDTSRWGSPALRRATFTLATTQLVSWGVLFYGFAVVAPDVTADTGWSESVVSGAFALGLLVAGLMAPPVARALRDREPRHVLAGGSVVGTVGMVLFATAPNIAVLYLAWVVIGVAMASTLYEPAMAVLVALDPSRRHRTLTAVTVAGGLASTAFAPLFGWAAAEAGWRTAIAVVGLAGGSLAAALHAFVLPRARAHSGVEAVAPAEAPPFGPTLRLLRAAVVLEASAVLATTAHLIGLLVDRGVGLGTAAFALGVMGVGKVVGRAVLLGPLGRRPLPPLAAAANLLQGVGLGVPLVAVGTAPLLVTVAVVGAASGATTVLRPLIVVDLVGAGPFAAVSARLQRASAVARAVAPFVLGGLVNLVGWPVAWAAGLAAFVLAGQRYGALGRAIRPAPR